MQTEIEEFLRKHYPKLFLASEVADVMKISRSSAQRQLKKLLARGRVVYNEGRYGCVPERPSVSGDQILAQMESLAGLTGIPRKVIDDWAEDVRAKKKRPAES